MTTLDVTTPEPPALPPPLWRRIFSFANVVTALFLAVCGTLIFRHAMWVDEAQAFLIARDSHSFSDLMVNMRYEGHPPLWHFLLFIITRFTTNPMSMQALHLLMATTTVYLVARFSPFPYVARFLFAFGYFPLFEYGVVSRNYQLVMLTTMAFCSLWQYRRTAYVRLAILLVLMCLSHVLGLIIATGFGVVLLLDSLVTRQGRAAIAKFPVRYALALLIAGGGAALTVKLLTPPADYEFHPEWRMDVYPFTHFDTPRAKAAARDRMERTLGFLWDGLVHIPQRVPPFPQGNFWKPKVAPVAGQTPQQASAEARAASEAAMRNGPLVVIGVLILLCLSWRAALFFIISVGGQLLFFHLKIDGGTRHHGEMFTAMVGAFWIAWAIHGAGWKPAKVLWMRLLGWVPKLAFIALMAVGFYGGCVAVYYIWQVPFTAAKAAGLAIAQEIKPADLVFADQEILGSSVAIYLPGHPFFYPARNRWGSFTVWSAGVYTQANRKDPQPSGMAAAQRMAREKNATVFYIGQSDSVRLPDGVTKVGVFRGGLSEFESYVVYRIAPNSSDAPAPVRPPPRPPVIRVPSSASRPASTQ